MKPRGPQDSCGFARISVIRPNKQSTDEMEFHKCEDINLKLHSTSGEFLNSKWGRKRSFFFLL